MWTGHDTARSAAVAARPLGTRRLTARPTRIKQRLPQNWELEDAREVQQQLLPRAGPAIAGLEYAGQCRPAASVGGDYYDFLPISDGRVGFAIGDVSGKGIPAALLMATLQASLRGLAISSPPALPQLMTSLNKLMYEATPSNRFATLFYGAYDPKSREFAYVNGGHNSPMVLRGTDVLRLNEGGPAVGLFGPAKYEQSSVALQTGDVLVLFTDGVSEAMNEAMEEFGEERLMEVVRRGSALKTSELIEDVFESCDRFAAGAPQHDDMTMLVVRAQ
jgi:sigma-B regulation protein RsbU (phosphoserine phosphatase)